MPKAKVSSVAEYLEQLSEERRTVVAAVRKVIKRHLPKGYREATTWGIISYEVPLSRFPDTYNGYPLCYVGLAAQKNHYALYLMCAYMNPQKQAWLKDQFKKAGKKLDMGKSCLRFHKLADLPLDAIGELVGSVTPEKWIACYQASRQPAKRKKG